MYVLYIYKQHIKRGLCCSFIDPKCAEFKDGQNAISCFRQAIEKMSYQEFVRFPTGVICVFLWFCLHCVLTSESNSTSHIQQG